MALTGESEFTIGWWTYRVAFRCDEVMGVFVQSMDGRLWHNVTGDRRKEVVDYWDQHYRVNGPME